MRIFYRPYRTSVMALGSAPGFSSSETQAQTRARWVHWFSAEIDIKSWGQHLDSSLPGWGLYISNDMRTYTFIGRPPR